MTINKANYAPDWDDIALAIRERAQDKCEHCGLSNGLLINRSSADSSKYIYYDSADDVWCYPDGDWIKLSEIPDEYWDNDPVRIVLTVAHVDQDTRNDDPANLLALCQRDHLNLDRAHNLVKAKRTRLANKRRAVLDGGQLELMN